MEKKIRLLTLTHNYPRFEGDYAGVFISLLLKRLVDYGIEPFVLAPHAPDTAEHETVDGVTIYRFRYADDPAREDLAYQGNMQQLVFRLPDGPLRFRRFLRRFQEKAHELVEREHIDVVAGHWLIPTGIIMKRLAKTKPLPMLLSSHGTDVRLMSKYGKAAYHYFKRFCRTLHTWTVVSNFLKEELLRLDRQLEDILQVLPLPHDETIFYRDGNIPRQPHLVVAVTRFTEQKRVLQLLESFSMVAEKVPEARLEIYGSGPLEGQVRQRVTEQHLEGKVTLHKPVPQEKLREVYNRAAVVVLNSYREGFGLALSEAMLCGAAVVGADSGGITDIIAHNERGLLVPVDDNHALAEAIVTLLNDHELRTRLAENGARFAAENYRSARLAECYARLVKDAYAKGGIA